MPSELQTLQVIQSLAMTPRGCDTGRIGTCHLRASQRGGLGPGIRAAIAVLLAAAQVQRLAKVFRVVRAQSKAAVL